MAGVEKVSVDDGISVPRKLFEDVVAADDEFVSEGVPQRYALLAELFGISISIVGRILRREDKRQAASARIRPRV